MSGLLFVYYHKYIHPISLSLASSAEGLLAVIAGGSGTLAGPIVGAAIVVILKNYVSAYIERWNMLLGFVFVLDRRVHARRAGAGPAALVGAPGGRGEAVTRPRSRSPA